jgi:hypothetical protein
MQASDMMTNWAVQDMTNDLTRAIFFNFLLLLLYPTG